MSGHEHVIVCEGVHKHFGDTAALNGFDLAVRPGVVHGLLGPNGAGKTTAVRILTTLVRPDGGRAEVAGFDVTDAPVDVRCRIGLVGQNAAVDEVLGGRQNLVMFGRLYHLGRRTAEARADALLTQFDLADIGSRPVSQYSGGMRRRLDLAASFIVAPTVLFLDEPTTGLDPYNRNQVWAAIRTLVAGGTTVLLTTQYLEEADQLASDIAVIDAGRVIATGSPDRLKSQIGDRVDVVVHHADDLAATATLLRTRLGVAPQLDRDTRRLSAPVGDRTTGLTEIVAALHDADIAAEDIAVRRPTLDEVFLRLTGHVADPPARDTDRDDNAATIQERS